MQIEIGFITAIRIIMIHNNELFDIKYKHIFYIFVNYIIKDNL